MCLPILSMTCSSFQRQRAATRIVLTDTAPYPRTLPQTSCRQPTTTAKLIITFAKQYRVVLLSAFCFVTGFVLNLQSNSLSAVGQRFSR